MSELYTLGACPAEEDTAQLGRTPDFERLNSLEVACYQATLIARYGPPPPGAKFEPLGCDHDFGHYAKLALRFDPENAAASAYAMIVDEGLGRWIHAGFTAPVEYPHSAAPVSSAKRRASTSRGTAATRWMRFAATETPSSSLTARSTAKFDTATAMNSPSSLQNGLLQRPAKPCGSPTVVRSNFKSQASIIFILCALI